MNTLSKKASFLFFIFVFLLSLFLLNCESSHKQTERGKKDECVILLHGLARSNSSMKKIEDSLQSHGYEVINVDYPSTEYPIEILSDKILNEIIEEYSKASMSKVHFVTHSLGGIVLRYYLKHHKLPNLGRTVMISPPNQGTELVDSFKDSFITKLLVGPAARQLGTDENSLPFKLGPVDFELGVIAGSRSISPLYSEILPGPDDGVISVERTKVAGMADFIVLPYSHPFIIRNNDVIEQVGHFLENGKFRHEKQ